MINLSKILKNLLICSFFAGLFLILFFWIKPFFSLGFIQFHLDNFLDFQKNSPLLFFFLYTFIFIISTSLALPSGLFFLLGSGFFFPIPLGIFICAFSFTLSAFIIYFLTQLFLSNLVEKKFSAQLLTFRKNLEKQQDTFLIFLRGFPLFPFFWTSVLLVYCKVPLKKYLLFTFLGLSPYSSIYVFLGYKLSSIQRIEDLLTPDVLIILGIIFALTLTAILFRKKITNH